MNIQQIFDNNLINDIKSTYIINNKIKSKAITKKSVFSKFPDFYMIYSKYYNISNFREIIYCILFDIDEIPKCKNPNCTNNVKLRNYKKGFQEFCCKKCIAEYYTNNQNHIKNCKLTALKRYDDIRPNYTKNLNCDYNQKNYYIFNNYCQHGNIKIYRTTANKIHHYNNGTFCYNCNETLFNNYIPSNIEIIEFQKIFPIFYNQYKHLMKYKWWITYYPKYFKIIITYFEKYIEKFDKSNTIYTEMYYQFLHNLKGRPTCILCNNLVQFQHSNGQYRKFCDQHLYGYNKSSQEIELGEFINTLNVNVIKNNQTIIQGELDFFFPDYNIAIEYNGCWWHSNKFKNKSYHYNKWQQCKNNHIQLLSIWEDDWLYKNYIIKNTIKCLFAQYEKIIDGNVCNIKLVTYQDTVHFLNNNHILGYKLDKIRLGLYNNNELISIMTFMKSKHKNKNIELIRFCNKLNYNVINSHKILFNYYINNYKFNNIVYYTNNDYILDKICDSLNMELIQIKDDKKYMYKGIRYTYNINKLNSYKCYSSGISEYMYKK